MKVTEIPVIVGSLGMVTKGNEKRLEEVEKGEWIDTIHTTVSLKSNRILIRVQETGGELLSLRLEWKTIS